MRTVPLLILGCLVSAPALAGVWSNLWRTPDQQGEALLAAGRPAQAAARFVSPRRKAYADLEAGRYAQAARLLAPFKGANSEYNRGNALAHLGHLHGALAAYDAALKQAPHDHDIRHNRDLVERMLAHRPPPRSTPKHGGAHGSHTPRHAGQGGARRHGTHSGAGHGQRAGQGRHAGQTAGHNGKAAPSGGRQRTGRGTRSAAPRTGGASGHGTRHGTAPATPSPAGTHPSARSPGQMRRNAARAAALARQQQHTGKAGAAAKAARAGRHPSARSLARTNGGKHTRPPKPPSQKKLALDQWLRQLPNDPAGLLRRKFLIEYLMRHPKANP